MRSLAATLHAWIGRAWHTAGPYLQIATGCVLIALTVHTWTLAADVSRQDDAARQAAAQTCEHRQTFGPHLAAFYARADALPAPILDAYREAIPDRCP